MGLLNIFIRLKLAYGEQMKFEISNLPSGGALITIGGPISK
jgi:two-component system sensor histidine kinase YesM